MAKVVRKLLKGFIIPSQPFMSRKAKGTTNIRIDLSILVVCRGMDRDWKDRIYICYYSRFKLIEFLL